MNTYTVIIFQSTGQLEVDFDHLKHMPRARSNFNETKSVVGKIFATKFYAISVTLATVFELGLHF